MGVLSHVGCARLLENRAAARQKARAQTRDESEGDGEGAPIAA
jgi:hypothetical protein